MRAPEVPSGHLPGKKEACPKNGATRQIASPVRSIKPQPRPTRELSYYPLRSMAARAWNSLILPGTGALCRSQTCRISRLAKRCVSCCCFCWQDTSRYSRSRSSRCKPFDPEWDKLWHWCGSRSRGGWSIPACPRSTFRIMYPELNQRYALNQTGAKARSGQFLARLWRAGRATGWAWSPAGRAGDPRGKGRCAYSFFSTMLLPKMNPSSAIARDWFWSLPNIPKTSPGVTLEACT